MTVTRRPCDLMRDDLTPKWCDQIAVNRALAGQPVGRVLHRAERVEVARRLPDITPNALADLIHCSAIDARTYIEEARPVDPDVPIDLWPVDELELDINSPIDLWPADPAEVAP